MYQNVIFDLDGTLLNTIDDLAGAANWVCERHGWPTYTVEEYKQFVGNGMAVLAQRFVPADWRTPVGIAQVLGEFMPYYDAHKEDKTAPYPGLPELLSELKGAGVKVAVLSNKAHSLVPDILGALFPRGVLLRPGGYGGPAHQARPHPAPQADEGDGGLSGGHPLCGGQQCGCAHRQKRRPHLLRGPVGLPGPGGAGP